MNTFDIKQEYRRLEELAMEFDPETGELLNDDETLRQLAMELDGKREEKLENIEYLTRENKAKSEALAQEIKRLQARKTSLELTCVRLTELQNELLGGEKLKTDKFTFSYRTTKSVEVPEKVDPEFTDWVNVKYTWDKTAIKKALEESGVSYDEYGVKLVEKTSLSVR